MRKLVLVIVLITALTAPITGASPAAQATTGSEPGGKEAVCFVPPPRHTRAEVTIHVPRWVARLLISTTQSYLGPCAEYGEAALLGNGTLRAYSQAENGVPSSVGVVMSTGVLDGLPYHPPSEGRWCFDKDGDGTEDPMTECSGGYERAIRLGDEFRDRVDSPFTYALVNWNPHGHLPPNVYDLPHFDIHFYLNSNAERLAIRPGPCPVLVNCEDHRLGRDLPDAKYIARDYTEGPIEPAMGTHLGDPTGPEWHGERFTHTFIYGSWDDDVTFYEPMVTHAWFRGLADGTTDDACFDIKHPRAWERSGWYPTEYCLRYRDNRAEVTASLEDFVYRRAS